MRKAPVAKLLQPGKKISRQTMDQLLVAQKKFLPRKKKSAFGSSFSNSNLPERHKGNIREGIAFFY
jgi:hypothetical protein